MNGMPCRETDPAPESESEERPLPGLFWVAIYLVDLEYGGPEEGGWYFRHASLVTDETAYAELGHPPSCHFSEAKAEEMARAMRTGLPALNEGRPPLSSVASRGLYEVQVHQAGSPPAELPETMPHYE